MERTTRDPSQPFTNLTTFTTLTTLTSPERNRTTERTQRLPCSEVNELSPILLLIATAASSGTANADLDQSLTAAIRNEYHAAAYCQAAMAKYGQVAPFTEVVKAERQHARALARLINKYHFKVPEDTFLRQSREPVPQFAERLGVPKTLRLAKQAGLSVEQDLGPFYARELRAELPKDVRAVFTRLQKDTNTNQVAAFRKSLNPRKK